MSRAPARRRTDHSRTEAETTGRQREILGVFGADNFVDAFANGSSATSHPTGMRARRTFHAEIGSSNGVEACGSSSRMGQVYRDALRLDILSHEQVKSIRSRDAQESES